MKNVISVYKIMQICMSDNINKRNSIYKMKNVRDCLCYYQHIHY